MFIYIYIYPALSRALQHRPYPAVLWSTGSVPCFAAPAISRCLSGQPAQSRALQHRPFTAAISLSISIEMDMYIDR